VFAARGLIPAGLDNVKAILGKRKNACILGVGQGAGADGCRQAVEKFLACPLIGGEKNLRNVDAAVLTLLGGNDLSIREIQTCLADFQALFPPRARLEVGAYVDDRMEGVVRLTALMCRYEKEIHQPALPLGGESRGGAEKKGKKSRKSTPENDGQFFLALTEQSLGIFKPGVPTQLNGTNLDIPTFQRKGEEVDIGEFG
jgi:cell division GTPase FtsZ